MRAARSRWRLPRARVPPSSAMTVSIFPPRTRLVCPRRAAVAHIRHPYARGIPGPLLRGSRPARPPAGTLRVACGTRGRMSTRGSRDERVSELRECRDFRMKHAHRSAQLSQSATSSSTVSSEKPRDGQVASGSERSRRGERRSPRRARARARGRPRRPALSARRCRFAPDRRGSAHRRLPGQRAGLHAVPRSEHRRRGAIARRARRPSRRSSAWTPARASRASSVTRE